MILKFTSINYSPLSVKAMVNITQWSRNYILVLKVEWILDTTVLKHRTSIFAESKYLHVIRVKCNKKLDMKQKYSCFQFRGYENVRYFFLLQ